MTLPPSVTLSDELPDCPILTVRHPAANGSIALLGGHVLEWTPSTTSHPVLYMSPLATFEEGKPIRGGIPICWPWFGPRQALPSHGFVRTRIWKLEEASETADGVSLTLGFASDSNTLELWPHPFTLELKVEMGRSLSVSLFMTNPGTAPVELTGALHTYICTGDITQTYVNGLDGNHYTDSIDENRRKDQRGPVRFDCEVDRIYDTPNSVRVEDLAWNRVLRVSKTGSDATVVWNPWIEKSKRLADLPDDAYPHFLCIEAANAGTDIVKLGAGGEHTLATLIEVL
jgi:glucose-6-phosphate 1-epimerase